MSVPQAIQVELRNGRVAWVERLTRAQGGGVWDWIGHIVWPGGKSDSPHVWRHGGQWTDTDAEHPLDIMRGLVIKNPTAAKEEHA